MNTTGRPEKSSPDHSEHLSLFGPPPLFDGEDTKNYDQILREVFAAVTPVDIFEQIWVREFVDLTIDVLRLRRLEANLMKVNAYKDLTEILSPLVDRPEAETLAKGWAARHSEAVEQVNKTLASADLSTDSILAQTFSLQVDQMERIQHMTALAETRRNATLREIDRHRQRLGQRLRRAARQLEDGQFPVIEHSTLIDEANAV